MSSKLLTLLPLIPVVCAQMSDPSMSSDAMDGMDMGGMAQGGMMTPWLHFALGDALWFKTWAPQTKGALAGAAIGLFLLAIIERWFASMRALMELHWREQMLKAAHARFPSLPDDKSEKDAKADGGDAGASTPPPLKSSHSVAPVRIAAPFILKHNVTRGVMHTITATLNFLFMLAIMTYQGAFFIAIVVGLGVGEIFFGRFAGLAPAGGH